MCQLHPSKVRSWVKASDWSACSLSCCIISARIVNTSSFLCQSGPMSLQFPQQSPKKHRNWHLYGSITVAQLWLEFYLYLIHKQFICPVLHVSERKKQTTLIPSHFLVGITGRHQTFWSYCLLIFDFCSRFFVPVQRILAAGWEEGLFQLVTKCTGV